MHSVVAKHEHVFVTHDIVVITRHMYEYTHTSTSSSIKSTKI